MFKYNYYMTPPAQLGFINFLKELQYHKIPVYLTDPKTDKVYCTLAHEQWVILVNMGCIPEYDLIHGPKETRYEPEEDNSSETVKS